MEFKNSTKTNIQSVAIVHVVMFRGQLFMLLFFRGQLFMLLFCKGRKVLVPGAILFMFLFFQGTIFYVVIFQGADLSPSTNFPKLF